MLLAAALVLVSISTVRIPYVATTGSQILLQPLQVADIRHQHVELTLMTSRMNGDVPTFVALMIIREHQVVSRAFQSQFTQTAPYMSLTVPALALS